MAKAGCIAAYGVAFGSILVWTFTAQGALGSKAYAQGVAGKGSPTRTISKLSDKLEKATGKLSRRGSEQLAAHVISVHSSISESTLLARPEGVAAVSGAAIVARVTGLSLDQVAGQLASGSNLGNVVTRSGVAPTVAITMLDRALIGVNENTRVARTGLVDTDEDGIPNAMDDDIDGDGVTNKDDVDVDGDGTLNASDDDIDGDGMPNAADDDIDGDHSANFDDSDIDGDGMKNASDDDSDGDDISNDSDDDSNGDGMSDDAEDTSDDHGNDNGNANGNSNDNDNGNSNDDNGNDNGNANDENGNDNGNGNDDNGNDNGNGNDDNGNHNGNDNGNANGNGNGNDDGRGR